MTRSSSPTPPPDRPGRAGAAQRLADRRRHIRTIRCRGLGLAAGTFLAVSGGILAQLVTGNDPALAHDSSATTTSAAATTSSPSSVTTSAS